MRSELGKISLDDVLKERDMLNVNIAKCINDAANDWGVQCLRHEIRDITPPPSLRAAMEMQARPSLLSPTPLMPSLFSSH